MTRYLPALILVLTQATAQEVVVPLPRHLPSTVVFVVDLSGSIEDEQLADELAHVDQVVRGLPFDGASYTAVAFGASAATYPHWVRHPDPNRHAALRRWLSVRPVDPSGTDYVDALGQVLAVADPTRPLTVIWITDGAPDVAQQEAIAARLAGVDPRHSVLVDEAREDSPRRTVRPWRWVFVGVQINDHTRTILSGMARAVGGGFVVLSEVGGGG